MAYDILIYDPVNAPALMRKAKRIGTAISPNIQDAVANAELIFVAMTCSDSPIAAEMTEVAEKLEFSAWNRLPPQPLESALMVCQPKI